MYELAQSCTHRQEDGTLPLLQMQGLFFPLLSSLAYAAKSPSRQVTQFLLYAPKSTIQCGKDIWGGSFGSNCELGLRGQHAFYQLVQKPRGSWNLNIFSVSLPSWTQTCSLREGSSALSHTRPWQNQLLCSALPNRWMLYLVSTPSGQKNTFVFLSKHNFQSL